MADIEFPYEPIIVNDDIYVLPEHHNRQGRQLAGLTERVNRFWPDDGGRPVPDETTDRYPMGFNEDRGTVEFWDGAQWVQLPSALANTFLGLNDTPASYSGQAGKTLRVNAGETGLEFVAPSGASAYAGSFEQLTPPTVAQIPDGMWGFWYKSDEARMIQIRNRGGTMYGVELNPV